MQLIVPFEMALRPSSLSHFSFSPVFFTQKLSFVYLLCSKECLRVFHQNDDVDHHPWTRWLGSRELVGVEIIAREVPSAYVHIQTYHWRGHVFQTVFCIA